MGLADSVAIAAAERVERTGGARAGLFAWRKLAEAATTAELRGTALLRAMRCATALGDPTTFTELARLWPRVDQGVWDEKVVAVCKVAIRADMLAQATELAASEATQRGTARALYAYARCLDVGGDTRAAHAFADAAARADKEGAEDLARGARIRRIAWLARSPETIPLAVEEARAVPTTSAAPAERLALARILLRSGSRFVRAGALTLLDDIVLRDGLLTDEALGVAARHADDLGEAITPLEVDRLLALFGREPVARKAARAREAVRALDRLSRAQDDAAFDEALLAASSALPELEPLHRRARSILAGRFEPHDAHADETARSGARRAWSLLLDIVALLRDGESARAARALRMLAEADIDRVPRQAWTVAQSALATQDADVQDAAAAALVRAMLARGAAAPPRGWLAVTQALTVAGKDDLASHTRRNAVLAKEPGAEAALAVSLTRAGWQLARAGDRARALAALREAKALSAPPPALEP